MPATGHTLPLKHGKQSDLPLLGLKVPDAHKRQAVAPVWFANEPTEQDVQVVELPAANLPAAQIMPVTLVEGHENPGGHSVHAVALAKA